MKLYIYDHCPFCIRARMAFALKHVAVELAVIAEGDVATPTAMVGRKVVPILQKTDGSYMAESLDIVRYVDALDGAPIFERNTAPELEAWTSKAWGLACKLFVPRFTQADFPELATDAARAAFIERETRAFGDLQQVLDQSPAMIAEMDALLTELAPLLQGREEVVIGDIVLWPVLRSLSIVKGLTFPAEVLAYMHGLQQRTGIDLLFAQAR